MAIIGIGTDIVEIERIKSSIERQGKRFLSKIYTDNEIIYCESKGANKWQSYAARFAAKEAVAKAMPAEVDQKISWLDVEVLNNSNGKISLIFSDKAVKIMDDGWVSHVTLSHHKTDSIATVIIENKG